MRYFIEFSYDGTAYFGYQIQPKQISVQEKLEEALSLMLRTTIKTVGAGRTDTGVHASQMFAHFELEEELSEGFVKKLNSFLPSDIAVKRIFQVDEKAHARFGAVKRTYKYRVSTQKSPFRQKYHAQYHFYEFDINKMNEAAKVLFDYIDFTSFSKLHTNAKTNNCKVYEALWEEGENELIFTISADRFLRNMVRAIVGTLLEIGREKVPVGDMKKIIELKDRGKAYMSAPAQGLTLEKVEYPEEIFKI